MKPTIIFLLPLLASATKSIDKRQWGIFSEAPGELEKPIKVTNGTASLYEGSVRKTLLYGPFKVSASDAPKTKLDPGMLKLDPTSDLLRKRLGDLCQECMVLQARADLADKDGKKMDIGTGVYSHHIVITNRGQSMVMTPATVTCPNGWPGGFNFALGMGQKPSSPTEGHAGMAGMPPSLVKRQGSFLDGLMSTMSSLMPKISVFVGQGDDAMSTTFFSKGSSVKTGFFIGTKDTFSLMAEVVNYEKKEQEVYLTLEYEYIPDMPARPKEWLEVGMGAINVSPCGSQYLHPPPDRAERYTSPPWNINADGYILDMKPHLHDGGINTTVLVNGKPACTMKAKYGGTDGGATINGEKWETITSYEVCEAPIKLKKGDTMTMEAWYDLTAHKLRPMANDHGESAEGMALSTFMFAKPG